MLSETFSDDMVANIKPSDIQRCIDSLPQSYTTKTKRNHLAVFSSVFSYAIRKGDFGIESNPCDYIQAKGKKSTKRRIATEEEIKIIFDNVDKPFGLFALFVLMTGCRRGEALAVCYEDIDRDTNTLHIVKSLSWKENRPFFKTPKPIQVSEIYIFPNSLCYTFQKRKKVICLRIKAVNCFPNLITRRYGMHIVSMWD